MDGLDIVTAAVGFAAAGIGITAWRITMRHALELHKRMGELFREVEKSISESVSKAEWVDIQKRLYAAESSCKEARVTSSHHEQAVGIIQGMIVGVQQEQGVLKQLVSEIRQCSDATAKSQVEVTAKVSALNQTTEATAERMRQWDKTFAVELSTGRVSVKKEQARNKKVMDVSNDIRAKDWMKARHEAMLKMSRVKNNLPQVQAQVDAEIERRSEVVHRRGSDSEVQAVDTGYTEETSNS